MFTRFSPTVFFLWILLLQLLTGYAVAETQPEIVINGVTGRLETNVRAYLPLTKQSCDAPKWKIEKLAAETPKQAALAVRALGYFEPKITYQLNWLLDCWQLVLEIEKGESVKLNKIDIQITGQGAKNDFFIKFLRELDVHSGDVLDQGVYENIKSKLADIADNKGYFDYRFKKSELLVNPKLKQADFLIHFVTGPRYYFGAVTVKQEILNPKFVDKYLYVEQDQPYDRDRITDTYRALDGSGYFKQVQIDYQENQADNYHAPVAITLQPLSRYDVTLGAGYDTDLGVRGNAEFTDRYINPSGHSFKATLNGAQRKSYALLDYKIPFARKRETTLNITGGFIFENTDSVHSKSFNLGASLTKHYRKKQSLTQQINFVAENFDSGVGETKFKIMLVPGFTWSNIVAEGKGFDLHGFKYSYQVQGAYKYLLSEVNFLQHLLRFKIVHNLNWGGRIIARTSLGATVVSDFNDLPTSYRFYAGGDNSVRGYRYKSIGTLDSDGYNIGGKFLTVASIEYEQLVYKQQWSLAVFADAGDAFVSRWNPKVGLGWGIRWYSPIGPVRVDMAVPSDDMTRFRFHISFSTAL